MKLLKEIHFYMCTRSMDQYITEVRKLSQNYGFDDLKQPLIGNRIICGIRDNVLREKLLHEGDPSLNKILQICRASGTVKVQVKDWNSAGNVAPALDLKGHSARRSFQAQKSLPLNH